MATCAKNAISDVKDVLLQPLAKNVKTDISESELNASKPVLTVNSAIVQKKNAILVTLLAILAQELEATNVLNALKDFTEPTIKIALVHLCAPWELMLKKPLELAITVLLISVNLATIKDLA